jgi:prepilin-type N-terminal cleavage/methylation domain-containing protein
MVKNGQNSAILTLFKDDIVVLTRRMSGRGYTMVELMVVAAIISILASMSFALLSRMRSQVIETNALAAMNSLATGYEMYYFDYHSYPQWGDGQQFASPGRLLTYLIQEEYIPRSYWNFQIDDDTGYITGMTQDYALEIPEFNNADPTTNRDNSYFLIFHPYNFQRDELAIGLNPPTGWVAVRARRGLVGGNYRNFNLYIFHRGEAQN